MLGQFDGKLHLLAFKPSTDAIWNVLTHAIAGRPFLVAGIVREQLTCSEDGSGSGWQSHPAVPLFSLLFLRPI